MVYLSFTGLLCSSGPTSSSEALFTPLNHCPSTDIIYLPIIWDLQLGKLGGWGTQTVTAEHNSLIYT